MKSSFVRLGAILLISASAALATACSSPSEPASTPPSTTKPSDPPSGAATPDAEPTTSATPEPVGDPTCATIIPTSIIEDFTELGWTVRVDAFRIGATEVPDGVQCTWGDFSVASDQVQSFGWAPIDEKDAVAAQKELRNTGWVREAGDNDEVYYTQDPKTVAVGDDDGYGLTYLFGDGWVEFADTKQSLLLIDWPPAQRE